MVTLAEQPAGTPEKTRIVFIDIGRSIAALLVFYTHIPGPWVRAKGEHAPFIDFIETFTSDPMHMARQGIGQLSVPFFFLVSGFVVTPLAMRQGHFRFGVNRIIRIYLPLGFVLALTSLALLAGLEPQSTYQSQELTPGTFLTNWSLANYLIYPQVVLLPVAWTMIIEVLFYLLLFVLLPVLRRSVWLAICIELTLVFVVLLSRSALNESWSLFAVNVSYLPIMIIGQTIWAVTTKRIPLWAGSVFGALAWMLYVFADIVDVGRIDTSYNLALAFATVCFLMGMFAEPHLKQRRFWTELSERSYSLYLLHALGIFVILGLLRPAVPFPIALVIMIAVTFVVVEVSYRFVERPSHALARKLSRLRGSKPAPPRDDDRSGRADSSASAIAAEITVELPRVQRPPDRPRQPPPQPAPSQPAPPRGGEPRPRPRTPNPPPPQPGRHRAPQPLPPRAPMPPRNSGRPAANGVPRANGAPRPAPPRPTERRTLPPNG
ncbi:acyltransferase family protein [Prauserella muralis]|uniref:acyltransferase family protein n=1 Tax=Prauserella muralis TaxID=588067 RepID=UPI000DD4BA9A|nr:acyltransferase [Prauserella muralis]TWE13826.1 peptidoglycan/LPS O-acetylase OafA/YrhL [Prauserella muralis]